MKLFYDYNLQIFVISESVCAQKALIYECMIIRVFSPEKPFQSNLMLVSKAYPSKPALRWSNLG